MIEKIITELKNFPGIQRKGGIRNILNRLKPVSDFGNTSSCLGDDAAVLRNGSEFLLLAIEEINRALMSEDPRWAGFCSVLANVNDIYAMGGTPLAMVNTVSFQDNQQGEQICEGIREACEKYRVPMVGGHFTPEGEALTLSVAILGKTENVLTSFDAQEGDALIIAVDLKGRQYNNFLNWNCITDKTSEEVLNKLGVMPLIAGQGLAHAAKDISNAGIVGTIGMLLETSGKGGEIFLDKIPSPEGIEFIEWLKMYPSYGFVLSSTEDNAGELTDIFSRKGYAAGVIGKVTRDKKMILRYKGERDLLFDFSSDFIVGA